MDKQQFIDWIRENFDVPGCAQRFIENILDYAEKLPEEDRRPALSELLSGGIGLTEEEIMQIDL